MKSFRPDKVASVVREVVSDMIANGLQDPRVSTLASVTRVEVSGDLQIAKVYISVLGSEADGRRTMKGLEHAGGHIQRAVARTLPLRHCPRLHFYADASIKKAVELVQLIDANQPAPDDEAPEASDERLDEPDGRSPSAPDGVST